MQDKKQESYCHALQQCENQTPGSIENEKHIKIYQAADSDIVIAYHRHVANTV